MIAGVDASIDRPTLPGYAGPRVMPAMPNKPPAPGDEIYRILDQVLATGVPAEIERGGRLLRIVPVEREADEDGFPVFAVAEGAAPITLATVRKALDEAE